MIKYVVKLSKKEEEELRSIINKGSHTSQTFRAAYILLNCNQADNANKVTNEQMSKILKVSMRTIDRVKKRYIEHGFDAVLERRASSRLYDVKIDEDVKAKLANLCHSEPPSGVGKWSLRLLADKMVELDYVDSISHVSVGNVLKKMNVNLEKIKIK